MNSVQRVRIGALPQHIAGHNHGSITHKGGGLPACSAGRSLDNVLLFFRKVSRFADIPHVSFVGVHSDSPLVVNPTALCRGVLLKPLRVKNFQLTHYPARAFAEPFSQRFTARAAGNCYLLKITKSGTGASGNLMNYTFRLCVIKLSWCHCLILLAVSSDISVLRIQKSIVF